MELGHGSVADSLPLDRKNICFWLTGSFAEVSNSLSLQTTKQLGKQLGGPGKQVRPGMQLGVGLGVVVAVDAPGLLDSEKSVCRWSTAKKHSPADSRSGAKLPFCNVL